MRQLMKDVIWFSPRPLALYSARVKTVFQQPRFMVMSLLAILAFSVSLVINYYGILFATERASNSVTDLILSNIPLYDVNTLFVYGTAIVVALSTLIVLAHPRRVPFALFALSLFLVIRAIFTSLTHIAPFESQFVNSFGETVNTVFFGADSFFSGHTGMPFLGALAFRREPVVALFFLASSLFFAVIVLLGHLHYSIDVLAAFFITYGIYDLACYSFPAARKMFGPDTSE